MSNDKSFKVQNGLIVEGDTSISGSVTAAAFFGDGSGLTNISAGSGGGLSTEAAIALIETTVSEAYVQARSIDTSDVEQTINAVVDAAYVIARQTGLTELEVANAIDAALNARIAGLDWTFGNTVAAPNFKEGTYSYTSADVSLQPNLGSLQNHVLIADATYTAHSSWAAGESLTLHLSNNGGHTITWPAGVKWIGGIAPTCTTVGVVHLVNLWKVGIELYGAYVGEAS